MSEIARPDDGALGFTRRALGLFLALLPGWILLALPLRIVAGRITDWLVFANRSPDGSYDADLFLRCAVSLLLYVGVWAVLAVPLVRATVAAEEGAPPNAWPYVLAPDPVRIARVAWAVVRVSVLVVVGMMLFVFPGVYLGLRLSLAPIAAAASDDARGGLETSWTLARGHLWLILGTLLAVTVTVLVISAPFWIVASTTDNDLVDAASTAITSCLGEATTVALTLMYLRFRGRPAPAVPERAAAARAASLFE